MISRIAAMPASLSLLSHDLHENRRPPSAAANLARPHNIQVALFKHYCMRVGFSHASRIVAEDVCLSLVCCGQRDF
jgi:hypothetical protein